MGLSFLAGGMRKGFQHRLVRPYRVVNQKQDDDDEEDEEEKGQQQQTAGTFLPLDDRLQHGTSSRRTSQELLVVRDRAHSTDDAPDDEHAMQRLGAKR